MYKRQVYAIDISRLEPACWWVGMKNPELQIMVYGKNIASSQVYIDYPGVRVKELVGVENPNYLFLYLDISRDCLLYTSVISSRTRIQARKKRS